MEAAGFVVVTAFTNAIRDGKIELEAFMRQHRLKVVVYVDIVVRAVKEASRSRPTR